LIREGSFSCCTDDGDFEKVKFNYFN
jgi:hypothetical protein